MNKDYENVLEDLALVYRLKQQAEAHKKESDALLEGTRVLLTAEDEQDLYKKCLVCSKDCIIIKFALFLRMKALAK